MIEESKVRVVCGCGSKHGLVPGQTSPVYYCQDERFELEAGMEVEIED